MTNVQSLKIGLVGGLAWILAAYLLSFLLSEAWDWTRDRLRKQEPKVIDFEELLRSALECQCSLIGSSHEASRAGESKHHHAHPAREVHEDHIERIDLHLIRDQLRLVAPSATRQILELRSEGRQCEVLMLGFGLLAFLDFWFLVGGDDQLHRGVLFLVLVLAAVLLYLKRKRLRQFGVTCAVNSYAMCVSSARVDLGRDVDVN